MILGMRNLGVCCGNSRITRTPKITRKRKLLILKWKTCSYTLFSKRSRLTSFRFKQRFKSLIEQYELRELHFHSLMRAKELEVQYNMARFDRERKAAEAEVSRSKALNTQVLTFSKTENELRNQLNIYVEKFKQVSSSTFVSWVCHIHVQESKKRTGLTFALGGGYSQ
jgi:hypothetical protein